MKFITSVLVLGVVCLTGALALTECQEHRERELKSDSKVKLVPRCTDAGEYESMQCFEGSPFCMCWRKDGSHITEPSLKLKSCKCIAHRDEVAKIHMVGIYRPQCAADGTYSTTQCHGGMGYCWCVDENGRKLPHKNLNEC